MAHAIGVLLAMAWPVAFAAAAVAGEARVHVQDGLASGTFDATPAAEALAAVHRATGVEVVVPRSVSERTLTLVVGAPSLELIKPALRRARRAGAGPRLCPAAPSGRLLAPRRPAHSPPAGSVASPRPGALHSSHGREAAPGDEGPPRGPNRGVEKSALAAYVLQREEGR